MESKVIFETEYRNLTPGIIVILLYILSLPLVLVVIASTSTGQVIQFHGCIIGIAYLIFTIGIILIQKYEKIFNIKKLTITSNHLKEQTKRNLLSFIEINKITTLQIVKKRVYVLYIYYNENDRRKFFSLSKNEGIANNDIVKIFKIIKSNINITKVEVIE